MGAKVLLTLFSVLAIGTLASTTAMTSIAYAGGENELPMACVRCNLEGNDVRTEANKLLLDTVPVSVWTDKIDYEQEDIIMISGNVADIVMEQAITITVVNPLNSIITIGQIDVMDDGSFATSINTAGPMWAYDGTYVIKVNYGNAARSNNVQIGFMTGAAYNPDGTNAMMPGSDMCNANEVAIDGDQCIPYSISGGMVTGAMINMDDTSVMIYVDSMDDGMLEISMPESVQTGMFMVLVDGAEWDDTEIDGNMITVMFPAGTESIEIIGTWVVPEFGTIAIMILMVAIISVVVISARTRLGMVMPRY